MIIGYAVAGLIFGAMFGVLFFVLMKVDYQFRVYAFLFQAFALLMMFAVCSLVMSVGLIVYPTIFITTWLIGEIVVAELLSKSVSKNA